MIIQLLFTSPLTYLMAAASITIALTIHEYAHAQMADALGDSTARERGRLTVNPLAHLDPLGALFIFTVGFGWGKPVPFNLFNIKDKRWGPAFIGLAGPLSNFIAALAVGLVLRFGLVSNPGLLSFFEFFVYLNILLGVFNLIPAPPLDGSHILLAIMGPRAERQKIIFLQNGLMFLIAAIFFMMYVAVPFIVQPLFSLLTGLRL